MDFIRTFLSLFLTFLLLIPVPLPVFEKQSADLLAPRGGSLSFIDFALSVLEEKLSADVPPDQALAELKEELGGYPGFQVALPALHFRLAQERGFARPTDLPGSKVDASAYKRSVGEPGKYPYTRSALPYGLRRGTQVRKYWSYATPADTNLVFRDVIKKRGGPSMAFDLPTQIGLDPDEAELPDVGGAGVSMFHLDDYEVAFDGIDLTKVSSNFTINGTAMYVVAAYEALARKRYGSLPIAELKDKAAGILEAKATAAKAKRKNTEAATLLAQAKALRGIEEELKAREEAMKIILGQIRGTIQNDNYKEYVARNNFVFPLEGTDRLFADFVEHAQRTMPAFKLVSVCGYHIREKESTPAEEIAYAISNALQYISTTIRQKADLDPNEFVPLFSFFFNTKLAGYKKGEDGSRQNLSLLTEAAKIRAGRRIWARLMKEALGLKNQRAHSFLVMNYSGGTEATKTKMELTSARLALQSLASLLGTPNGTNSYSGDEAVDIPGMFYGRLSLLTDYITLLERGITDMVDPAGGSFYLETLTDQIEREIWSELKTIAGKETYRDVLAYMRNQSNDSSQEMENALQVPPGSPKHVAKVGRNVFREGKERYPTQTTVVLPSSEMEKEEARKRAKRETFDVPTLTGTQREALSRAPPAIQERISRINRKLSSSEATPAAKERLVDLRAHLLSRDNARVQFQLERLERAAQTREENLMDITVEAIEAGVTVGEWKGVLAKVYGLSDTVGGMQVASADSGPWNAGTETGTIASQETPVFTEAIREFIEDEFPPESNLKAGLERGSFQHRDTSYGLNEPTEAPGKYPYTRGTSATSYKIEAVPTRDWSETVQDPFVGGLVGRSSELDWVEIREKMRFGEMEEVVSLDGWALAEAGANAETEIATLLYQAHTLVETLLKEDGISPSVALQKITLTLSVGDDAFTEVAKFRVARKMWAEWFRTNYELSPNDPALKVKLRARTSAYVLSKEQSWANEARIAQQAMLAAWGGADSIEALPFDFPFRDSEFDTEWSDWGDQMALDTVRLVKLEAGADGLRDPLGGSFVLEQKTTLLAQSTHDLLEKLNQLSLVRAKETVRSQLKSGLKERQSQKRVGEILNDPRYPKISPEEQYTPEKVKREKRPKRGTPPEELDLVAPEPKEPPRFDSYLTDAQVPWQFDLVQDVLEQNGFATKEEDVNRWVEAVRTRLQGKPRVSQNFKVIAAKVGADTHDRGVLQVVSWLSKSGMEVIYLGLRASVEGIGKAAIDEDASLVAISSPAALDYVKRLWRYWEEAGIQPLFPVIAGGAIPPEQIEELRQLGIPAFGPETSQHDLVLGIQELMFRNELMEALNEVVDLKNRPNLRELVQDETSEIFDPYKKHPHLYWPPHLLNEINRYYFEDSGNNSDRLKRIQDLAFHGGVSFEKADHLGGFVLSWPNGYRMMCGLTGSPFPVELIGRDGRMKQTTFETLGNGRELAMGLWRDIQPIKAKMRELFYTDPYSFFAEPLAESVPRIKEIKAEYLRRVNEVLSELEKGRGSLDGKSTLRDRLAFIFREEERTRNLRRQLEEKGEELFEEAFALLDKKYLDLELWERWNIGRTSIPQTRLSPRQMILESGLFQVDRAKFEQGKQEGRNFVELADPKQGEFKREIPPEEVQAFLKKHGLDRPVRNLEDINDKTLAEKKQAAYLFLKYGLDKEKVVEVRKKFGLKDDGEAIQVMVAQHEIQFDDPTIFTALARYKGPQKDRDDAVLVVAVEKGFTTQERKETNQNGYMRPRGMWKITRAIRLAEMLRLPVLFLNDATGAWVGVEADLDDQGQAISRVITVNLDKRVPGVSVITGEAGSAPILATSVDPVWMLSYAFRNTSNPYSAWIFENIKDRVEDFFFGNKKKDLSPVQLEDLPNIKDRDITELLSEGSGILAQDRVRKLLFEDFKDQVLKEISHAVGGLPMEQLKNGQIEGIIAEPFWGGLRDREKFFTSFGEWFSWWLDEQHEKTVEEIQRERREKLRQRTSRYSVHPNPPTRNRFEDKRGQRSMEETLRALTAEEGFREELNSGIMSRLSDFYTRIPSLKAILKDDEDLYGVQLERAIEKTGSLTGVATGWADIVWTEEVNVSPPLEDDDEAGDVPKSEPEKVEEGREKVMLVLREPHFIAGSKAGPEGEKITLAMEEVIRHYDETGERIPVVMITTGAGARSADQAWGMEELAKNNDAILQCQKRGIPVIDVNSIWVFGGDAASTYPAATVVLAETFDFVSRDGIPRKASPWNAFVGPKVSNSLEQVPQALKKTPFRKQTHRIDDMVDRKNLPKYLVKLIQTFRRREKETNDPEQLMLLGVNNKRLEIIFERGKKPFEDRSRIQDFALMEAESLKKEITEGSRGFRVEGSRSSNERYDQHFNFGTRRSLFSRELPIAGIPFEDRYDFNRLPALLVEGARKILIVEEERKLREEADSKPLVILEPNRFARARGVRELRQMVAKSVSSLEDKDEGVVAQIFDAGPSPAALPFWADEEFIFNKLPDQENLETHNRVVGQARARMFGEVVRLYDELGYDVKIDETVEYVWEGGRTKAHDRYAQRRLNLFVHNPNFGVEYGIAKETTKPLMRSTCRQIASGFVIVATKRTSVSPTVEADAASATAVADSL